MTLLVTAAESKLSLLVIWYRVLFLLGCCTQGSTRIKNFVGHSKEVQLRGHGVESRVMMRQHVRQHAILQSFQTLGSVTSDSAGRL